MSLIQVLIERNAITVDTEIKVGYSSTGLLVRSVDTSADPTLQCVSTIDGSEKTVAFDAVVQIDGMTLDRISDCYEINLDGSSRKIKKKRGRKPKIDPNIVNELLNDKD